MRPNPIIMFLVLIAFIIIVDAYFFKALRLVSLQWSPKARMIWYIAFGLITLFVFAGLTYLYFSVFKAPDREEKMHLVFSFFGIIILFYVPKLFVIGLQLTEDIVKLLSYLVGLFLNNDSQAFLITRKIWHSKILTTAGFFLAIIPFLSILYGITIGKFNYQVEKQEIYFDDLPKQFDGLKIAQISDLHVGSLGDRHRDNIEEAIELLNAQQPDLIFFTGDLVNNTADELDKWIPVLKKLNAKTGMFSILGNHDYGDYASWDSDEAKKENLESLIKKHGEIGFNILLNQARVLKKNGDSMAIIGVQNWGDPPFPQYGDLDAAQKDVRDMDFKILLSHDPSHWRAKVTDKTDINLTLSGHTHAMQFGIDIGGFRWSPIKYRYPEWRGLYKHKNQYLYVNIGFGFIGFPGRVGSAPEITLIHLKRKS